MTKEQYNKKINTLIKWAKSYYMDDNPVASDDEYDLLSKECLVYENKHPKDKHPESPNFKVYGKPKDAFVKAKHITRMWSQEDIFNNAQLFKWLERSNELDGLLFITEPKIDGLSLNLIYDNGKLDIAITRGDGSIGEEVTVNALMVNGVLNEISYKGKLEVRGEVYMGKKEFDALNESRLKTNEATFANPRNAAAGSLRQLNSNITKERNLTFRPWSIGHSDNPTKTILEDINLLNKLGFIIDPKDHKVCKNIDEIDSEYIRYIKNRDKNNTPWDGMMVKIDDKSIHDNLGYTNKFPKWSCALKFPPVEKVTKLIDVLFQIGKTGVITPVGSIEPVNIDGSMVSKVTLHNFNEIKNNELMLNDNIIVIKSGDIIPKITKVLKDRRDGTEKDIVPPKVCPWCKHDAKLLEHNILYCTNEKCKGRLINQIVYFASRECMNIDTLGYSTAKLLVENKLVTNEIDLYYLTKEELLKLPGFKPKKSQKLLDGIAKTKGTELYKVLASISIPFIGTTVSRELCSKFGMDILKLDYKTMIDIPMIGEATSKSFTEFLSVPENKQNLSLLIKLVNPTIPTKRVLDHKLSGMSIAITGSFEVPRKTIEEMLININCKVSKTVSIKTDYLVLGENGGTKENNARALNVKIISYSELMELYNEK